jgi:hypothetical protein
VKSFVLRKLTQRRIWGRILNERLAEPLHMNLLSLFVALFGSYRSKIAHDLVVRPNNAYAIMHCAEYARAVGIKTVSLLEFGVAAGAGLLNMAKIAANVSRETGVNFKLYGFDTGQGMPPPNDYRDHPDLYREADFPMEVEKLRGVLPSNVQLLIGNVSETVAGFLATLSNDEPIGYVVFDLDYYSSTVDALRVLKDADPKKYLPVTCAHMDDIHHERHNSWCGELLAIDEFNREQPLRKIEHHAFLAQSRLFRRASWIPQMFYLHVLDHPGRRKPYFSQTRVLANPYL